MNLYHSKLSTLQNNTIISERRDTENEQEMNAIILKNWVWFSISYSIYYYSTLFLILLLFSLKKHCITVFANSHDKADANSNSSSTAKLLDSAHRTDIT